MDVDRGELDGLQQLFQLRKLATDTEKIISWPVTEFEALLKFKLGREIITSVHSN